LFNSEAKKMTKVHTRKNKSARKGKSGQAAVPKPTFNVDKPSYNPTWNPQFLKVARTFQYSTTAGDLAGGYGVIQDPSVTCSTTVHAYGSGALTFAIDKVPNVTEFGSMFDQYRIAAAKVRFDFISGTEAVMPITSSPSQRFMLLLYEDYDDSTAPPTTNSGFAAVFESGRALKALFPSKKNYIEYTVRPKYLVNGPDYAGANTAVQLGNGWLDGATNAVLWRGLKWIAQANPSPITNTGTWRVTATYFLEWRNRQ